MYIAKYGQVHACGNHQLALGCPGPENRYSPSSGMPSSMSASFSTRHIPLSIVLKPELQAIGDPRFLNSDASRALARAGSCIPTETIWGQGCAQETTVPASFSPLRMLASRRAGAGATMPVSSSRAQGAVFDAEHGHSSDESEEDEDEPQGDGFLGSDDFTDFSEFLASQEADATNEEEEEDIDDGIPEEDE